MGFSNLDLANIAKEIATVTTAAAAAKAALPVLAAASAAKSDSAGTTTLLWTSANDNKAVPYETERSFLDGNTATPITMGQITDAAQRTATNIFFPAGWTLSNAKLIASGNGNPFTTNASNESAEIALLTANINLLVNGQSSGVGSDTLFSGYAPGSPIITVENGGQTVGSYLLISGGGSSALVKVNTVTPNGGNYDIAITEVVPPAGNIPDSSTVLSNIPGFTNSERQSLTSGSYQSVLTYLTNQVNANVTAWNTALSNQLTQLNANTDTASGVATAKTNVGNAQTSIATWNGYPNTGAGSKYSDTGLNFLSPVYGTRSSAISGRVAEIVAALGSVTQDSLGNYSGAGVYYLRFKALNMLINGADGAMYEAHGATTVNGLFEAKIGNAMDKISMFKDLLG